PVLAWIALYSYTKRFTLLCHLFLGGALAASPIAAAIAIDPSVFSLPVLSTAAPNAGVPPMSPPAIPILLLAAFVLFWVAGFDIAYALQDIDFDRRTGLRSIPARLGPSGALWISRFLHAVAFAFLFFASRADPRFGLLFLSAVIMVGALLIFEHIVLARRGVAGLPIAFFTVNGVVSCLLGAAGIVETLR
ncbi:MAG: UbiA family prenyltransferase, partial [Phycisphaerae bacterium]|nr:UbiA family prenyltransferase [Phycisphaerae bacterium]